MKRRWGYPPRLVTMVLWGTRSEYYDPKPTELAYRGHAGKLFKRDFAGELLDKFPDLDLVDYGFVYHRDRNFPQDDLTGSC